MKGVFVFLTILSFDCAVDFFEFWDILLAVSSETYVHLLIESNALKADETLSDGFSGGHVADFAVIHFDDSNAADALIKKNDGSRTDLFSEIDVIG